MSQKDFDQHTIDWGEEGVEFNLPTSGWFKLFRSLGYKVIDYLEPRPEAPGPERTHHVTLALPAQSMLTGSTSMTTRARQFGSARATAMSTARRGPRVAPRTRKR